MAITLSGTIQNCYSTAKIRLTGFAGEVGGLVGTFRSGAIKKKAKEILEDTSIQSNIAPVHKSYPLMDLSLIHI